jgi:cyclase
MLYNRVIPCLLLKGDGLVKTVGFAQPKYLGDPLNVVRLFNDLEVDELIFLDINATPEGREPDFDRLHDIASQCFMPISYGGGVRSIDHARRLFQLGVEKVALTTAAAENPALITQMADCFGRQSVIVGIDVKRNFLGKPRVWARCGKKRTAYSPIEFAREAERLGAGEILLSSIDRDGAQQGYDLELIGQVAQGVNIPVIACGGAGSTNDLAAAIGAGASAVAAGSLFVFRGPHRAVLISYPSQEELRNVRRGGGSDGAPGKPSA